MTTVAQNAALRGPAKRRCRRRRAVVRWAWRMFRREWRQQILVHRSPQRRGGGCDRQRHDRLQRGCRGRRRVRLCQLPAQVRRDRSSRARTGLDSAKTWFGTTDVIGYRSFAVPGSVDTVEFRAQDPHGAFGSALLALRRGSYPVGPRQVALTDGVADLLGARARRRAGPRRPAPDRRRHRREPAPSERRVRPRLPRRRGCARHRHRSRRRRCRLDRPLPRRASFGVVRLRPPWERPGGRRLGDVLRRDRLPAPRLAGRRRGLHRDRAAATPPARHAGRDRCDAEAPATRTADQRCRRRRDRLRDRDGRGLRGLVGAPPDARDRVRSPHRPAQPALGAACADRPRRDPRRHDRRLVARAGGRPRSRHARPLGATAQAEAGTPLGDPGRPPDRGRNRQPCVRRPVDSAPHRRRAPGDDPRHPAPGPTGDPHLRAARLTRSHRPTPGAAGPRPLPGPLRSGTRRHHPRPRNHGCGRHHRVGRGEARRRPDGRRIPQTSPTASSGCTQARRESLSSSRSRSRRPRSSRGAPSASGNSPPLSGRPQ